MHFATLTFPVALQGITLISLWAILYQAAKQQGRSLLRLDDLDRRLAHAGLVAVANGSLLALFGLVQAFASDPNTLYWVDATGGTPFGPFINKNHFAFHVNVCVGLGVGLLLGRLSGRDTEVETDPLAFKEAKRAHRRGHVRGGVTRERRVSTPWLDPASVGLTFALGLMITSVLFSPSRGRFLACNGSA
jgi:hypothetical protein